MSRYFTPLGNGGAIPIGYCAWRQKPQCLAVPSDIRITDEHAAGLETIFTTDTFSSVEKMVAI